MAKKKITLINYKTGKAVQVSRKTADRVCAEAVRRLRAQERKANS